MRFQRGLLTLGLICASCGGGGGEALPTPAIPFAEESTTSTPAGTDTSPEAMGPKPGCATLEEIVALDSGFDAATADPDAIVDYMTASIRLRAQLGEDLPDGSALAAQGAIGAIEFIVEVAEVQGYRLDTLRMLLAAAEDNGFDLNSDEHALVIYAASHCELDMDPFRSHLGA